ncbi:hypothetical protein ACTFJW_02780 [Clostridium cagae]
MGKKIEFKFIVDVPPDEETIRECHRVIAQALINKYGIKNMKKVLERIS